MSYNPFLDPNFKDNMEHFKRTGDSSVFRDSDYNLVESDKQRQSQSLEENSSVVQTDIISVPNTEDSNNTSPFDHIRHIDNNGQEYWEARELQGLLGYVEWRKFEDTIERAKSACLNVEGEDGVRINFVDAANNVKVGFGYREVNDYRLTRYACYLIAMNGDIRKPEIAAAQTYFMTDYNRLKEQEIVNQQTGIVAIPDYQNSSSPFDRIKHKDTDGEYWLAKELQGLLGYQGWDKFKNVIEKGKQTCNNIGEDANYHIRHLAHMSIVGNGAKREVQDYRLTRYACYIIAMNGDSSKPEIAAAQTYFAVKTRQAELQQFVQRPTTTLEKFAMVLEIEQEHDRRISALESCTQQLSQDMEDRVSQLQKIRNDINELQNFNRIECPPAIISKRCNNINGIIYKLDSTGKLSFSDSKQLAYDIIFNRFNLDVEQELEKYKVACRRYYEHYKIYNGTPPKDVLRPAAIEKLGWVSWVSIKKEIYDAVLKELKDYYDED